MKKLLIAVLAVALSGGLFPLRPHRHRPAPEPEHHPGPQPRPEEPEAPPPSEPEVPEHERAGAPPADPAPSQPQASPTLDIRVDPAETRRGKFVQLHLDPPVGLNVNVFWQGKPIPKETVGAGGAVLKVRIPGDATGDGKFQLEWKGKRYDSPLVKVH